MTDGFIGQPGVVASPTAAKGRSFAVPPDQPFCCQVAMPSLFLYEHMPLEIPAEMPLETTAGIPLNESYVFVINTIMIILKKFEKK